MLFEFLYGGCDVARGLGAKLSSAQIPTATDILPNVERWNDPATQATITKLGQSIDKAEQKTLTGDLVNTMMTKYPVTPLIYAPSRILYRTDKAVGLAQRAGPVRQPVRRPAAHPHPPDARQEVTNPGRSARHPRGCRAGEVLRPQVRVLPGHAVGRHHPELPHPPAAAR